MEEQAHEEEMEEAARTKSNVLEQNIGPFKHKV